MTGSTRHPVSPRPTPPAFATCPFSVAVDTREQLDWTFQGLRVDVSDSTYPRHERGLPLLIPTQPATLNAGDYSIVGHENEIAIERKSPEDLYGSIGRGRGRFQRELERLAAFPGPTFVIVEAPWTGNGHAVKQPPSHNGYSGHSPGGELWRGPANGILTHPPDRTELLPKIIMRSVIAWNLRFPSVHWHMMGCRAAAEVMCFRLLERWWKLLRRAKT